MNDLFHSAWLSHLSTFSFHHEYRISPLLISAINPNPYHITTDWYRTNEDVRKSKKRVGPVLSTEGRVSKRKPFLEQYKSQLMYFTSGMGPCAEMRVAKKIHKLKTRALEKQYELAAADTARATKKVKVDSSELEALSALRTRVALPDPLLQLLSDC